MMPTTPSALLAHQGGWDELAYLIVPAVLALGWVRWAGRRARIRAEEPGSVRGDDGTMAPPSQQDG